MEIRDLSQEDQKAIEQVLGYLNFSSGAGDTRFLANLNRVFALAANHAGDRPLWRAAWDLLEAELRRRSQTSAALKNADQVAAVLALVRDDVLPGYGAFHRDLLFHQDEKALFNSLFVARVCEAVLRQGPPWEERERIAGTAIRELNDYIGHRPVAALESQKIEPYEHEWVRPVPLYIRGAGAAFGPYQGVVEAALRLLQETDPEILHEACLDPALLDELAFDPRAYDFDHPVNKRPNYHFGQWDPHHIDNRGYYRRYVVQQVTLDALMSRLGTVAGVPPEEMLFEAASVLAGTILMSTGVSGTGPETHDSTVTLANLLPRIAGYRDRFYERLLEGLQGRHGKRLRQESVQRRQPFGGARQHLNAELARRRAAQLEHVHLAAIYARMGYFDAASREADIVPAASARMLCQIDCRLTAGEQAIAAGDLERAVVLLEEIMAWVHRGIQCGAIVDPWDILGFDANFSLFPALENTVRDHRVDELVALMEEIFTLYSRTWGAAAARDDQALCERIAKRFRETAAWWRRYAAHEVSSVEAIDADDAYQAAAHVAEALNLWHKAGASVDDVRFWTPHAEMFDSPKAYALVINALLERHDFVTSMALMIHWLGQAERIGLARGDTSFFDLAELWMVDLRRRVREPASNLSGQEAWKLACKFLDYLEANAEEYWEPPSFELGEVRPAGRNGALLHEADELDEEPEEDLFGAAYENVVYRDSTDDGIDSELMDYGQPSDDALMTESRRVVERLSFISSVARLWQMTVTIAVGDKPREAELREAVGRWIQQAAHSRDRLRDLIDAVLAYPLPTPSGDHDSMVEYDRVRTIKESVLEQAIATSVDTADAIRILSAAAHHGRQRLQSAGDPVDLGEDVTKAIAVFAALLHGDTASLRKRFDALVRALLKYPLLYVPLAKGGNPHDIIAARIRQRTIQDLLAWLPRAGRVFEACQLIEVAREMERLHPVGPGAVTEFDDLFKIGYKALVRTVVHSAASWDSGPADRRKAEGGGRRAEDAAPHRPGAELVEATTLVECLKRLTESLLSSWLAHSRTLRLSVLEKAKDKREWHRLVAFIERYGADIFTQRFLNLANLRAILHEGVDNWLEQLGQEPEPEVARRLLDEAEQGKVSPDDAVQHLSLILEAIVENYGEYRDYNSMTTQSDRGELLYTLLDFLRLRIDYDRICWQLKPVVWAHEILVRAHQTLAAEMWRRELADQTSREAEAFLQKLAKLQTQYAMRMPTVADRLGERFVRPMIIDRIRALVRPAMDEVQRPGPAHSFQVLQKEIETLTREPTGAGLDVPAWLVALEDEVGSVAQRNLEKDHTAELDAMIPQATLSLEETQRQLEEWSARK